MEKESEEENCEYLRAIVGWFSLKGSHYETQWNVETECFLELYGVYLYEKKSLKFPKYLRVSQLNLYDGLALFIQEMHWISGCCFGMLNFDLFEKKTRFHNQKGTYFHVC